MELAETFDYYWYQKGDPTMNRLPFMESPIIIPSILFSYLYFVLKCGPKFMKDKKPYSLKTFIKYYNIFQIISNAMIVQQFISAGWFTEILPFCDPENYTLGPRSIKMAYIMWFVMVTKIIDLFETGVFVLRKKDRQISFLHLYHHVSTLLICWILPRYVPVAGASFFMLVNSAVHVIMYTYYLLSSFGGKWQMILNPFKPLITIVQMVQFIVLIAYAMQPFHPNCDSMMTPSVVMILDLIINFVLFYNFYQTTYVKSAKKVK